ncbi:uncharacterized protein RAG0_05257 [Rhynchosporium agropyri]|uniref:Uncharacterized protein n=1 Tax=Rhynchosporium agropyri TaxID=914238 RepID=A0A1E1KCH5_9HELO|nr:uncharacterized protein RAG0_05257 [Rhynchosporium agropyri]
MASYPIKTNKQTKNLRRQPSKRTSNLLSTVYIQSNLTCSSSLQELASCNPENVLASIINKAVFVLNFNSGIPNSNSYILRSDCGPIIGSPDTLSILPDSYVSPTRPFPNPRSCNAKTRSSALTTQAAR